MFGFFQGGGGVVEQAQHVGAVDACGAGQVGGHLEQFPRPQGAQVAQAGGAAVDGAQVFQGAQRQHGVGAVGDGIVVEDVEEVGEVADAQVHVLHKGGFHCQGVHYRFLSSLPSTLRHS